MNTHTTIHNDRPEQEVSSNPNTNFNDHWLDNWRSQSTEDQTWSRMGKRIVFPKIQIFTSSQRAKCRPPPFWAELWSLCFDRCCQGERSNDLRMKPGRRRSLGSAGSLSFGVSLSGTECSQIVQWLYSQRVHLEISNPGQYFGISLRVYSLARLSLCLLLCVEVLEDRKGCCCFVVLVSEESKHTHTQAKVKWFQGGTQGSQPRRRCHRPTLAWPSKSQSTRGFKIKDNGVIKMSSEDALPKRLLRPIDGKRGYATPT